MLIVIVLHISICIYHIFCLSSIYRYTYMSVYLHNHLRSISLYASISFSMSFSFIFTLHITSLISNLILTCYYPRFSSVYLNVATIAHYINRDQAGQEGGLPLSPEIHCTVCGTWESLIWLWMRRSLLQHIF